MSGYTPGEELQALPSFLEVVSRRRAGVLCWSGADGARRAGRAGPTHYETVMRRKDGARVPVEVAFTVLQMFPLDVLKVDKSSVGDIPDDENDAIVSTIVSLGHALDLEIIAEGVETREQLNFLRERGCDQAQGYYLSPPAPADGEQIMPHETRKPAPEPGMVQSEPFQIFRSHH